MRPSNNFLENQGGAAAVEFAMIAVVFIMTLVFISSVAIILYMNFVLDNATSQSARQIMIGSVQANSASLSEFKTEVLCPRLPAMMLCSNVIVNLYTVPQGTTPSGYYTFVNSNQSGLIIPTLSGSSGQFALGAQGAYQYLQVIYPITFIPAYFSAILSKGVTYNGSPAYLAVSTAAFRNEQY